MNWIILIVAGLCEVGFTYCLGRAKSVEGLEWYWSESSFSKSRDLLEDAVHIDAYSLNRRTESVIIRIHNRT